MLATGCADNAEKSQPRLSGALSDAADARQSAARHAASDDGGLFTEITSRLVGASSGQPWPDGKYFTPEISPGGVALFDYDNDGDLDIYQVCHAPAGELPDPFNGQAPNRLFRQESDGRFVEVSAAAGLDNPGFGHGAAIGDVDNDGDLDVYVTNFGPNALYINDTGPDGTLFHDASEKAGVAADHWSSSAAFFDYDQDGWLDLYVVNFGEFDQEAICGPGGEHHFEQTDFCGPQVFPGVSDALYRNNRDGTFTDVSEQVGIHSPARGWGVIAADLTGDRLPDIYVANDSEPNQLWVNQGDGTFVDEGLLRGVALNAAGHVEASMGVAIGDVNGDAVLDLFMTHLTLESNTLYMADPTVGVDGQSYTDHSASAGLPSVDRPYTGWGCALIDFDHDGDLDLAVANGRVARGAVRAESKVGPFWSKYAEPNLLFQNDGSGRFKNVSDISGTFASHVEVTRGLACGDLDGDGDIDIVTCNVDNTLRIFRNNAARHNEHWLVVRAMVGARDAIGARLSLRVGQQTRVALILPSYSYLSSSDPQAHFGLGPHTSVSWLDVTWPDGAEERFQVPGVDVQLTIHQGKGTPLAASR